MFNIKLNPKITAIFLAIFVICLVYLKEVIGLIKVILDVLSPVFLGLVLALLLNIPMRFVEEKLLSKFKEKHKKGARAIALTVSFVLAGLIVFCFFYVILPRLLESTEKLIEKLPLFLQSVFDYLIRLFGDVKISEQFITGFQEGILNAVYSLLDSFMQMTPNIADVFSGVAKVFSDFFFAIAFAGYLLFDKEGMKDKFSRVSNYLFSSSFAKNMTNILYRIIGEFSNFFQGQVIEAVILGFLCFVGMLLLDIPYALFVSIIVGVTAVIPLLGAIIGTVPSAIIIMIESPSKAVIFLIFIVVLQTLEGNLIYPHVVGNKIELPAFFVLLALVIGGGLMGIYGIIICVPVFSVLYDIMSKKTRENLEVQTAALGNNKTVVVDNKKKVN
ncbi:MAG: AI-2E family transporter [Clostridia bacterium]|nr:AI-2E family transporter [Clostridia bacterium]